MLPRFRTNSLLVQHPIWNFHYKFVVEYNTLLVVYKLLGMYLNIDNSTLETYSITSSSVKKVSFQALMLNNLLFNFFFLEFAEFVLFQLFTANMKVFIIKLFMIETVAKLRIVFTFTSYLTYLTPIFLIIFLQVGLDNKKIQLNLCNIFSILLVQSL